MLSSTMLGLAIALIVISSVAWVSQFRRIRNRIRIRKAHHTHHEAARDAH
jgi:hypothetical protein